MKVIAHASINIFQVVDSLYFKHSKVVDVKVVILSILCTGIAIFEFLMIVGFLDCVFF